ncbi:MAG: TIGR01777 family protein [Candidatus Dadabacteria bacterium]|nr:MAG: TIGR01777 family protein [Candidatus Dadabacteria bacterium]
MKVLVTGGTGFVGRAVVELSIERGDAVTVLSRTPERLPVPFRGLAGTAGWEGLDLSGYDTVVHLAGENLLAHRWSPEHKQRIRDSRVEGTRKIVRALEQAEPRPSCLISASAVGYYGPQEDDTFLTEDSPPGAGFLAEVCRDWEAAAVEAERLGLRVVRLRIGVVLDRSGGALERMIPIFQKRLGGRLGHGRQWVSWIHRRDLARLVLFAADHEDLAGPVNGTAPRPERMRDFVRAIARQLGKPCWLPAPGFMLRMALGEGAEVLLTGQRVLPARATNAGFHFEYPELDLALEEILREEVVP